MILVVPSIPAPQTPCLMCIFFFTDTATTEIYTLSLHDALPIPTTSAGERDASERHAEPAKRPGHGRPDRPARLAGVAPPGAVRPLRTMSATARPRRVSAASPSRLL